MYIDELNIQYNNVYERLVDEESRRIFENRFEYLVTRDINKLEEKLYSDNIHYTCQKLDKILRDTQKNIVIFGAGECGKKNKKNLDRCRKYNIKGFCDNNLDIIGTIIEDIPVISVKEAVEDKDCVIVISSIKYGKELYEQLLQLGVSVERIVTSTLGFLEIQCGWQYFDFFEPGEKEIFLDAGTYDGGTIVDFYKWMGNKEGICYGMEPVPEMYKIASRNIKSYANAKIYNYAAWNRKEDLKLNMDTNIDGRIWGGSSVSDAGIIKVMGESIDDVLEENGTPITLLKMDIEGSERKALEGARKSIIKYKPRMAISVYHKPEDILEIPNYILTLDNRYNFALRHYTGNANETVLYAEI